MNSSLAEQAAAGESLHGRVSQLQRALSSSEHDRSLLQERLEHAQYVKSVSTIFNEETFSETLKVHFIRIVIDRSACIHS